MPLGDKNDTWSEPVYPYRYPQLAPPWDKVGGYERPDGTNAWQTLAMLRDIQGTGDKPPMVTPAALGLLNGDRGQRRAGGVTLAPGQSARFGGIISVPRSPGEGQQKAVSSPPAANQGGNNSSSFLLSALQGMQGPPQANNNPFGNAYTFTQYS